MAEIIPGTDGFLSPNELKLSTKFSQADTYRVFDNTITGYTYDYVTYHLPKGNTIESSIDIYLTVIGQNLTVAQGGDLTGGIVTDYRERVLDNTGKILFSFTQVNGFSMSAKDFNEFTYADDVITVDYYQKKLLSGDDVFVNDTMGDDSLFGEAGNDKFVVYRGTKTAKGDYISGGDGVDTVSFLYANRSDANIKSIKYYKDLSVEIDLDINLDAQLSNNSTRNNVVLDFVEIVKFKDGSLIFDVQNTADNSLVYRLYQAAFARTPDEGGFRFWVDQHNNNNQSFNSISSQFIASTEFKTKYGSNPTNAQLVDLLYQNVLGRAGEAGGVSYWNNELNTGHQSKEQVLIGFAGSPENVANTAANIDKGYWFV